jgi:hypothetical protein
MSKPKLMNVLSLQDYKEIERAWERETPAIVMLCFDACLEYYGYDISFLESEEQNAIFLAALDAEIDGDPVQAALEALSSLAVAGGWEECLCVSDEDLWDMRNDEDGGALC